MTQHQVHVGHDHTHGPDCGHFTVQHEGHTDYLHDGHLHHLHDGQVDEHLFAVDDTNPAACTPDHACGGHDGSHQHAADCGHPAVPHGDHTDYLIDGHLHSPHGDHCDDHGAVLAA